MEEGFIKFYRRAKHSKAWSRGIEYRGLLITLLTYATYKESTFIGQKIERGQVALSLDNLSQELRIERTKLHRMLKNLEKDEVITVSNVQHRFTLVTIINYSLYQDSQKQECNTDATPVQHECNADAMQVQTLKEGNKEIKKESKYIYAPSGTNPPQSPDFETFWKAYPNKKAKQAAFKAWAKNKKALPGIDDLIAILERHKQSKDWTKDGGAYIPHPATWINRGQWEDEMEKAQHQNQRPEWMKGLGEVI